MRFRLTYDGPLPAMNKRKRASWAPVKWKIREQISPQLIELYEVHPILSAPARMMLWAGNQYLLKNAAGREVSGVHEAVREPISVGSNNFISLVRKSLALSCSINVIFLRRHKPGQLVTGGDIDNRMQILFDALQIPDKNELAAGIPNNPPSHYLLEDDSLVTGISIQTDRLLIPKGADPNHALLMIDVTIRVMELTAYNIGFIGD
jgi:hypothetical protein